MVSIQINENLLLRSYTADDATALFEVIDKNRAHLRPWLPWVDVTTRAQHSLQFIEDALMQEDRMTGLAVGIFHKQEIIGGIGMLHWDHHLKKASVGYWIAKDFEGQGMATTCIQRFISYLFEKLSLNKVEIQFVTANKRSAAIATRLNAKIEGILRDSYLRNGMYEDLVVAGILRKEWNPG